MKTIKKVCALLIACAVLLMTACSATVNPDAADESATELNNSDTNIGEPEQQDNPEKVLIEAFYDAAYEIYQISQNYKEGSLYEDVAEHVEWINTMIEYAVDAESEYFEYIDAMRTNSFVEQIVKTYLRGEEGTYYSFVESVDADIFKLCSEEVLTTELPFGYETQLMFRAQQNAEKEKQHDMAEISDKVLACATNLIKSGSNIVYKTSMYSPFGYYSTSEISGINTDYGELTVNASMEFTEANDNSDIGCMFYLFMEFSKWNGEYITHLSVNGVEFYSTQIAHDGIFGFSYDEDLNMSFASVYMFKTNNDPSMNESFREFQSVMTDSTTIEMVVNHDWSFVLDEDQTKEVKDLLALLEYTEQLLLAYQLETAK